MAGRKAPVRVSVNWPLASGASVAVPMVASMRTIGSASSLTIWTVADAVLMA